MVEVNLWSGLRHFTDGAVTVEVEAKNVGEVLEGLVKLHPELGDIIDAGVSVAVDGKVIASGLTGKVRPESEVFIIQQLKGG